MSHEAEKMMRFRPREGELRIAGRLDGAAKIAIIDCDASDPAGGGASRYLWRLRGSVQCARSHFGAASKAAAATPSAPCELKTDS